MTGFEVLERDGLARRGRFDTPHGSIETPTLLPVIHPDRSRQPVAPEEIRRRLGLPAVIASSYITWRNPELRAAAERDGIHAVLGFTGPVMTDSGAFQQHAYGDVEVTPEEIVDFQHRIRSDIVTVLDEFTEPDAPVEVARRALATTIERGRAARARVSGLLAVPVQGGSHPELRAQSARAASEIGDVLAIGGVVPLFEQYRFSELAREIAAARPELAPRGAVHLFGTGHPMTFAFAALFGVDLFDSSAYWKFARRGRLLFPEGTVAIDDLRERTCFCRACEEMPLPEVAHLPLAEREPRIAWHNLVVSAEEIGTVRQAIREGTLWELAERRTAGHPALRAGLTTAVEHPETFLPTEPASRRAFREVVDASPSRPAVVRFQRRLASYRGPPEETHAVPRIPLRPDYLRRLPLEDRSGRPLRWESASPIGAVPLELTETYPVGPYLGRAEFDAPPARVTPESLLAQLRADPALDADLEQDWTDAWDRFQVASALRFRFGAAASERLTGRGLRAERSRRTGRLRTVLEGGRPVFVVGDDGFPRPTYRGAPILLEAVGANRERVVVQPDAVPFVAQGKSLFARFVERADPDLAPDATAVLVDTDDRCLAIGRLLLAPHEMRSLTRGVAVRVTAHARSAEPGPSGEESM